MSFSPTTQDVGAVYRSYLLPFYHKAFSIFHPGTRFEPGSHLEAIGHCLDECIAGNIKRLIITVPPRSGKTGLASIAFPALLLARDPGKQIMVATYAEELSRDIASKFRRLVKDPWYAQLAPRVEIDVDTQDLLTTKAGGCRRSTSVAGAATGMGADVMIIDDLMKASAVPSAAQRDATWRYYSETLVTRLNNKKTGVIIVIQQRLHEDDLVGRLLAEGGWHHLNLPAIATVDDDIPIGKGRTWHRKKGDLLSPEREGIVELDTLRRTMGTAAFLAQYQQQPVAEEGNMVKRDWLKRFDQPPPRQDSRVVVSLDTAIKGDPSCDYSVWTVWYERQGKHHLVDVVRGRYSYPELRTMAFKIEGLYRPDITLIEDKGNGSALIAELRLSEIRAKPVLPTGDKEGRLAIVLPSFEFGEVILPRSAHWLDAFEAELFAFPKGKYDDQVDSVSQYLGWARDNRRSEFESSFIDLGPVDHSEIAQIWADRLRWAAPFR